MKLCITSQGTTLDAKLDPRFGRCQYFMFIDSETGQCESMGNPHKDGGGAGIQVGQVMADKKVDVVLTGNVGPNASQTLAAAGIKIVTGVSGSVNDVLEQFKQGKLNASTPAPTVHTHFGKQA